MAPSRSTRMQGARAGRFAAADTDGDGVLTRDELGGRRHGPAAEARVDRLLEAGRHDGDGAAERGRTRTRLRDARRQAGLERMFQRAVRR